MDQETDDPHDVDVYAAPAERDLEFKLIHFATVQGVAVVLEG